MDIRAHLLKGQAIPAHPLALTAQRKLDERHQRALTRYYVAAGAGGLAVGVHSTQFAIRDPKHGLFQPVLELASRTIDEELEKHHRLFHRGPRPFVKIAGLCGRTAQAVCEAKTALSLGYDAGLLSMAAFAEDDDKTVLAHCREVAKTIPIIGFYLQPAVGGRAFSYAFWRKFCEIPSLVAIKIAPFNRYQTLDVVRAVVETGRNDVALYTGNDDNILFDLLTHFKFQHNGKVEKRTFAGGLLGQWAVWTHRAVRMLGEARVMYGLDGSVILDFVAKGAALTDANAAIFDVAHAFHGCIPGIHEVLRRQGLMAGTWCLDENECLSPGQADEITRVTSAYPFLTDDDFVAKHRDEWLS